MSNPFSVSAVGVVAALAVIRRSAIQCFAHHLDHSGHGLLPRMIECCSLSSFSRPGCVFVLIYYPTTLFPMSKAHDLPETLSSVFNISKTIADRRLSVLDPQVSLGLQENIRLLHNAYRSI